VPSSGFGEQIVLRPSAGFCEKFDRSPLAKGKKFYQKFCLLTEKILKKLFLFIKFSE
jgi:hypothetical protein